MIPIHRHILVILLLWLAPSASAQKWMRLTKGGDSRIKDVLPLDQGRFIAIGQHFTYSDSITMPNLLILMDSNGTELARKAFGQDGYNKKSPKQESINKRIKSIVQLPSGAIWLVGDDQYTYGGHGLWLMQIDPQLNIIRDTTLKEIPISNSYYLHAFEYQNDLLIACQSYEQYQKENWRFRNRQDVRVVRLDEKLQVVQEWKSFAEVTDQTLESLNLRDAYLRGDSLWIGVESQWTDSLDSADPRAVPNGIKMVLLDLKKNQATTWQHLKEIHQLMSLLPNDRAVYFTSKYEKIDTQQNSIWNTQMTALNFDHTIAWQRPFDTKSSTRFMRWEGNAMLVGGDQYCNRGQFRFVQKWSEKGDFISEENSFCDYTKEMVGMTYQKDGRRLLYFIDNGWFVEIQGH
jgi:hypothetical protein